MSLIAHGNAFISVKVVASNVRIERRLPSAVDQLSHRTFDHSKKSFLDLDKLKDSNDGLQPFLVFKIDFKIRTILRTLQVDHINVGKGCDIRLGRLRVFSYCGLLKKKIDRAVKQISSDINEMHAPAIIHQLQQFLKGICILGLLLHTYPLFFSLDQLVTKNQTLSIKCQRKVFVLL